MTKYYFRTREIKLLKRVARYAKKHHRYFYKVDVSTLAFVTDINRGTLVRMNQPMLTESCVVKVCPICMAANIKLGTNRYVSGAFTAAKEANLDISKDGVNRIMRAADLDYDPLRPELLKLLGVEQ